VTTALTPFDFSGATLRGGDHDGEPVLVGKDVCDALGIIKYRDALAQLDDDERVSIAVDTPGGRQQMTAVTEGGIWSLAFIARSPQVKAFRRWVTHDVLPAIRRTGTYSTPVTPSALPTPRELAVMLIAAEDAREAAEAKVAELEPKADLADTYLIAQGGNRKVREAAKLLAMRERDLRRFLIDERLIFARHARCGDVQYDFYAEFAHHFQAIEHIVNHTWGSCSHYTLTITPRGIDLIRRRMAKVALPADEAAAQLATAGAR
jgi:anti-repressor protein